MNMTTSASCSMAPDSRSSDGCGPRSSRSAARGDELEIVHDEERKSFVALEAARLGADFEHAGGTRVIHPKRRGGDGAECLRHAAPVFAAEMAGAELVRVHLRDRSDQALQQGLLGHFQ